MHQELSEYQYSRMLDNESIRILVLDAGEANDPLKVDLETVNVDDAGSYEPLSYVWGQPGPCDTSDYRIFISTDDGERQLEITGSLFGALRRLRLRDRPHRIWADQVCIDQKNLEERGQQVQFMNKIYKNASHVLVWLGVDEAGQAESAIQLIHKLEKQFKDEAEYDRLHIAYTKDFEDQSEDEWRALDHLTGLSWFKRSWVVQEIGTDALATVFWGNNEIDWNVLHTVCEKLTDYHHLRSKLNIRTSDVKYFFKRFVEPDPTSYHANRFNFIYELHRARGLKVSDDRDRIFAWLGHYSVRTPNEKLASLRADYEKTVEEAYIDLAERALIGTNDEKNGSALIVLAAVQHKLSPSQNAPSYNLDPDTESINGGKLPSWVPDWRIYQSFILSEPINAHRAHGKSSPKLEIGRHYPVLRIYGVEFDVVTACSHPLEAKEFHVKSNEDDTELAINYLWREICLKTQFNLHDKYPDGQEAFFAYMQTLSNGCVQIATREGTTPYHDISKSRWLEHHAMALVKILGQSHTIAPEIRDIAEAAKAKNVDEQWSRSANGASKNRVFARTKNGYYVLGPKVMEKGDIVCVLFGGKMPFCLRPWGNRHLLVGECYVHGLMNGEAIDMMDRQALKEKKFELM